MRPFLEKQLLRTLQLWDQRDSGLWRANPRQLLNSILSSTQGIRLLKTEKLELDKTVQMLVRHKRLLDWLGQEGRSSDGCQWSRRLKVLQSSKWKELRGADGVAKMATTFPCSESMLVSFPDRLYDKIFTQLGPIACREFCEISNEIPTWTFLRRNSKSEGNTDALLANLIKLGHQASLCQEASNCIQVENSSPSAVPLSQLPSYLSGEVEIQDESSQLVTELVTCRPTDTVIDLCSGAGGKALSILSRLSSGCLVLHDPRLSAVKRAKQRVLRAQAASPSCFPELHFLTSQQQLLAWKERANWVLIDAPCSNTGSLRRHPEWDAYRFCLKRSGTTMASCSFRSYNAIFLAVLRMYILCEHIGLIDQKVPVKVKLLEEPPSTFRKKFTTTCNGDPWCRMSVPDKAVRHQIPADNSCLFNSVAYALDDRGDDKASELRDTVAAVVLSDPDTPGPTAMTCDTKPQCCGAEEIAAVDIKTLQVSFFGEGYSKRAFVIYDGIHYDVLVRRGASGLHNTESVEDADVTSSSHFVCGGTRQIHKITSEWDSVEDLTPNDLMIKFTERSIEAEHHHRSMPSTYCDPQTKPKYEQEEVLR
eukprot:Skav207495  [mRNA]  locus=scaffold334:99719:114791:+ [translate_table: standard]